MAPMKIRPAALQEQAALSALHRRSSLVWEENRADLEAHPDALGVSAEAIAAGEVRVAADEAGALLGFSIVKESDSGAHELDDLFVEPDHFRRGIGRALVEDAAGRAAAAGASRL